MSYAKAEILRISCSKPMVAASMVPGQTPSASYMQALDSYLRRGNTEYVPIEPESPPYLDYSR